MFHLSTLPVKSEFMFAVFTEEDSSSETQGQLVGTIQFSMMQWTQT